MPNINLLGVHIYADRHGKERCQFRFGPRTSMATAPVGSPEWLGQYYTFRSGSPLPKTPLSHGSVGDSVNAVIDAYLLSRDYRKQGPKTQRNYIAPIESLRKDLGEFQMAAVKRKHIVAILNKTENDWAHNILLIVVRKIVAQAIDMELRDDDPAQKIDKILSQNPLGRRSWTLAYIEQYRARHPIGTVARLALEIGFNTGLRISDILLFGRQHLIDGGKAFHIVPRKTAKFGNEVRQSIRDQHLIAALAAAPVRGQRAFLCTAAGEDFYDEGHLSRYIAQWCKEAGVPDYCRAHGWRKAFAVAASHAGCSNQEIMALLGDRDPKMVELYTKERDTWLLSESAADKVQAMRAKRGA